MNDSIRCEADYNERMTAPKLNESQKRYLILFENHVDIKTGEIFDKQFERDIKSLRSMNRDTLMAIPPKGSTHKAQPMARFIVKYDFPAEMANFLYEYIVNDNIDALLIHSGLYLVSDATQEAVGWGDNQEDAYVVYDGIATHNQTKNRSELKLVIPPKVTLKQAKDFLTLNWDFVKEQQSNYLGKNDKKLVDKIRPHFNARRDYRVIALLEKGLSYKEVAIEIQKEYPTYSPTYMEIAKIKSKLKRKDIEV